MAKIRDRSTGDLLVMMVAGTVCFMVLVTGVTIMIVEIVDAKADTSTAVRQVTGIVNTLIGLLAGFLAGRTDYTVQNQKRETAPPP